jgi:hypothetical protein
MVIEHYRPGQAAAVYQRFRERGRGAPEGLSYISSWVDLGFQRCFQVMQTEDASLLQEWTQQWSDLVDFEIVPVQTSEDAAAGMASESRDSGA